MGGMTMKLTIFLLAGIAIFSVTATRSLRGNAQKVLQAGTTAKTVKKSGEKTTKKPSSVEVTDVKKEGTNEGKNSGEKEAKTDTKKTGSLEVTVAKKEDKKEDKKEGKKETKTTTKKPSFMEV